MRVQNPSNLRQRNGVWYFRYTVPMPCEINVTKRAVKEISFSLKTGDKSLAFRLAATLSLFTQNLVRRVLTMSDVSFEMIDDMVKNHFERLLMDACQNIDFIQMYNTPSFGAKLPIDPSQVIAETEEDITALQAMFSSGVFSSDIEQIAASLSNWKQICLTPGDNMHEYLCRMIVRAQIASRRMKIGALKGDPIQANGQDAYFADCQNFLFKDDYNYYLMNQDTPYHEAETETVLTLRDYMDQYWDYRVSEKAVSETTLDEEKQVLAILAELLGGEKRLTDIGKDDTRALFEALKRFPAHFTKRFPNKSIREVIDRGGDYETVSVPRQQVYWQTAHRFFDWAVAMGYLAESPMISLKMKAPKEKSSDAKKGVPFKPDDLAVFFASPLFTGFEALDKRQSSRTKPGNIVLRDAYYWLPLVALFTGARIGELIQLTHGDIAASNSVPYLSINDEGGKRTKNASSTRKIPVHPMLIKLGFMNYAASLLDNHQDERKRVFEQIHAPIKKPHNEASKWFQRYLDGIGMKAIDERYRFHSLRHTFEDAARAADMPDSVRYYLQGRAERTSAKHYGDGYKPENSIQHMERIQYPCLDDTLTVLAAR